ncbi:carbohydrate-binding protein [Streptomyces sp. NPDC008139]|uniref:carbohydrate-binding protein n=1 Tax=Streptomyces sp. NPDC008139 TaxID=3364814 RepID=UPI0036EE5C15
MTAGNDGAPENDDPFGYLYRSEGGEQQPEQAPVQQPGMPRTSHHQIQRVGERRPQPPQTPSGYGYPQQQSPSGYGYPQQTQQQTQAYGQQPGQQQYGGQQGQQGYPGQQPPAQPPHTRRAGGGGQQGGGAPNRKGLLIAAVAVVAAVAIGIAFAMTNGSGDGDKKASDKPSSPAVTSAAPTETTPSASAEPTPYDSKKTDASTLVLTGGAQTSTEHPGASAAGGTYVDHLTQVGATVTWTVTVPKDGPYTLFTYYGNAGDDATLTLGVNGTPRSGPVNLKNYGHYTDWAKAWNNHTYSWIDLKKGSNTVTLSCQQGNQCAVNLDQFELKQGQVTE